MGVINGWFEFNGLPRPDVPAKLWKSGKFATAPVQNTALPGGSPTASTTTGESHGGGGAYRFTGVAAGTYYVSFEYAGERVYQYHEVPELNVQDYGALGDGTTNDSTAFQAAIDAAEAAGGGTVYIPATTSGYLLSAGLTIDNNYVRVVGDGDATLLINNQDANPVINILGTVSTPILGIAIEGLRITRPGAIGQVNNTHIQVRYANFSRIARVYSNNAGIDGIFIRNCDDFTIEDFHAEDARVIGILTYECRRVRLINCSANQAGQASGAGFGLEFKNTSESVMVGCRASDCKEYGIFVFDDALGSFRCFDNHIIGCFAEDNDQIGFYANVAPETQFVGCTSTDNVGNGFSIQASPDCLVSGCAATGSTGGAGIGVDATSHRTVVTGNRCYRNNAHGIVIAGCDHVAVTGNVSRDNGWGLANQAGIALQSGTNYATVTGNNAGRTDTATSQQKYGVDEQAGANNNVVVANTLDNNVTAAFLRSGADSIFWNEGGKVLAPAGIGVGNSAAATTPGSVTKKIEVFDASGASLGFLAVYNAIT